MSQLVQQGVTPSVTIGGVTLPLSKAIMIHSYCTSGARFSSFYNPASNAYYQVPVGKKFVAIGYIATCGASASAGFTYGSGTASVIDSGSGPAGGVTITGLAPRTAATVGARIESCISFEVAAGRYPYFNSQAASWYEIVLVGYEVEV